MIVDLIKRFYTASTASCIAEELVSFIEKSPDGYVTAGYIQLDSTAVSRKRMHLSTMGNSKLSVHRTC